MKRTKQLHIIGIMYLAFSALTLLMRRHGAGVVWGIGFDSQTTTLGSRPYKRGELGLGTLCLVSELFEPTDVEPGYYLFIIGLYHRQRKRPLWVFLIKFRAAQSRS